MPKSKKAVILFFSILIVVLFLIFRVFVWPLFSIFTNKQVFETQEIITQEQITDFDEEVNSWQEYEYLNFSLKLPNVEEIELEEYEPNTVALLTTDPDSGNNLRLLVSETETGVQYITQLIPEDEVDNPNYDYTVIGEYNAIRIGPSEPPYDNVTYFIVENGVVYQIDAIFSAPVVFLDQVLSSFKINNEE